MVGILPMNPGHATKIGFFGIFAYANRLALAEGIGAMYGVNILGKQGAVNMVSRLQESVAFLDINPTHWWLDSSITESAMTNKVAGLFANGCIEEKEREIKRCSCGNVEYLGKITLLGTGKTLFDGKYTTCCHSQVVLQRERVLVTAPLPLVQVPKVFPSWADRELETVLKVLAGSQLLVSRKARRFFRAPSVNGGEWELDNDLLWWLYLHWLQDEGFHVRHLVVGASVIRQTGVLLAFSALLGVPLPESVHCLPNVLFEPVHDVHTLEQIVSRFGKVRTVNALVWSALSARKKFTLRGSVFPNMYQAVPTCELTANSRSLLWQR